MRDVPSSARAAHQPWPDRAPVLAREADGGERSRAEPRRTAPLGRPARSADRAVRATEPRSGERSLRLLVPLRQAGRDGHDEGAGADPARRARDGDQRSDGHGAAGATLLEGPAGERDRGVGVRPRVALLLRRSKALHHHAIPRTRLRSARMIRSHLVITKSTPLAPRGMVTAEHPAGAEVGAAILARGGNAVDAAVATAFAMPVVEPFMSTIGVLGPMVS